MSRKFAFSWLSGLLSLVCLLILGKVAFAQEKPREAPEDIAAGREIYLKRCWFCHGREGAGDGPVAQYLDPRPRNFTTGIFKLRTTKSGEAPTDEDLFQTISLGIPGTAMQGFEGSLTRKERWQVLAFLKTLVPDRFDPKVPPERAELGTERTGDPAKGKEVYRKAKCWECHGDEGRGDGPSANQLQDDWGFPILPANLTKGWRYKGGNTVKDIFTRLTTGMDGTPMPSFADSLSVDERWHLAAYVRSLIQEKQAGGVAVLKAKRGEKLPSSPDDPLWEEASPLDVPLSGQVMVSPRWQNPSVDHLKVRALYDEKAIALLLEWDDRFKDTVHEEAPPPVEDTYARVDPEKRWTLRDAAAVQFPLEIPTGPTKPYFLLGDPKRPVVLWRWKADWNEDPERLTAVEKLNAEGPRNPLTPLKSRDVLGKGAWSHGQWKVMMIRALKAEDKKDITFEEGRPIPIAFYVWDGSNGERDLMMSVSSWYYLILEVPTPTWVYAMAFLVVGLVALGEWWLIRWARAHPRLRREAAGTPATGEAS